MTKALFVRLAWRGYDTFILFARMVVALQGVGLDIEITPIVPHDGPGLASSTNHVVELFQNCTVGERSLTFS